MAALNDSQVGEYDTPEARAAPGGINKFLREFAWRQDASKQQNKGSAYGGRRLGDGLADSGWGALAGGDVRIEPTGEAQAGPASHAATGAMEHHRRRRLSQHDEWGGVLLTLRLARFANVYTLGPKQTILDLIAIYGGASGSLIGLLGLAIFAAELAAWLAAKVAARQEGGRPGGEAEQADYPQMPVPEAV